AGSAGEKLMGIILPVTLTAAAAAAIINLWLAVRVGQMRGVTKTIHGDDAGGPLTRRMRAQLNFVENTPFALALIAAIELTGRGEPAKAPARSARPITIRKILSTVPTFFFSMCFPPKVERKIHASSGM
ncbi:MAG: MAPEG family protein, partial [Paracoccus sp. (in: a-proteobacteria)]